MLIQLFDSDGRETWVNPIHVKVVRTRQGMLGGKKGTEIWVTSVYGGVAINVDEEPTAVAIKLNAAMPEFIMPRSIDSDDVPKPSSSD